MLHLQHFGLREQPFGITPDTSFYFACQGIQEALNTLIVAVANGEGFIKITGDVGTGKTMLCRKFLASLDDGWVSAYIPNPNLEPRTLLLALAEELGFGMQGGLDQHHLIKAFNLGLLDLARQRKRVVVCLDETQAMPLESLETLRLLTNLETEKRKLVQVVLFGQPELDDKLAQDSIRQLRQRITFQHRLGHLSRRETSLYLAHRLYVAGYRGDEVFTRWAVAAIYRASRGVPRLVNILASKSLLLAYGEGGRKVTRRHARAAIIDTPASVGMARAWMWMALACVACSTLGWVMLK